MALSLRPAAQDRAATRSPPPLPFPIIMGTGALYSGGLITVGQGDACWLGGGTVAGPASNQVALFLVIAALAKFVVERTRFDRALRLIGMNPAATSVAGLIHEGRHAVISDEPYPLGGSAGSSPATHREPMAEGARSGLPRISTALRCCDGGLCQRPRRGTGDCQAWPLSSAHPATDGVPPSSRANSPSTIGMSPSVIPLWQMPSSTVSSTMRTVFSSQVKA